MEGGKETIESGSEEVRQPGRQFKRIEAIRAEDFWDRGDDEWDPYSWDPGEYPQSAFGSEGESGGEQRQYARDLWYTPFDAEQEIRNLKKLPKGARPARLAEIKRGLEHQKEGTAFTIQELHAAIAANPDASFEKLISLVEDRADKYGFTSLQMRNFSVAIKEYFEKHETVEKYRKKYPRDEDLFEVCFGRKPKGKVEVVKGSLTLHIRCYDSDDYVLAYWFGRTQGEEAKIQEGEARYARLSGGAALAKVKNPRLEDIITIENALVHMIDLKRIPQAKEEKVQNRDLELWLPEQRGNIGISVEGGGNWELQIVERDERDEPSRLRLINTEDPETPLFDVLVIEAPEETQKKFFIFKLFEDVGGAEKKRGNVGEFLRAGEGVFGYVLADPAFVRIQIFSKEATVRYTKDDLVPVIDEHSSEKVRAHEEQHQFNKLFIPVEVRLGQSMIVERIVESWEDPEKPKDPEEVKRRIIHNLVRFERKWVGMPMDSRARDEILAYYKDGSSTQRIFETLTTSPLYNYAEQYKESIAKIPAEVKKFLEENITLATYMEASDEEGSAVYPVDAAPLEVDIAEVEPYINVVFRDEYKADLRKWLNAVELMEKKGYTREEILALCYQGPARSWPNLARRLKDRLEQKEKT